MKRTLQDKRAADATWRSFCDLWYWIGKRMQLAQEAERKQKSKLSLLMGMTYALGQGIGLHLPQIEWTRVPKPPTDWDKS